MNKNNNRLCIIRSKVKWLHNYKIFNINKTFEYDFRIMPCLFFNI